MAISGLQDTIWIRDVGHASQARSMTQICQPDGCKVTTTRLGRQRLAVEVAAAGPVGGCDVEANRARRQPPDVAELLTRRLAESHSLIAPVILHMTIEGWDGSRWQRCTLIPDR